MLGAVQLFQCFVYVIDVEGQQGLRNLVVCKRVAVQQRLEHHVNEPMRNFIFYVVKSMLHGISILCPQVVDQRFNLLLCRDREVR